MKVMKLSLVEANIIAIHPDKMIQKGSDLETLFILNYYIKFPICASFEFITKEKVSNIKCVMKCGYIADMVIPGLSYCQNISKIRKHFENVFFRSDEESKQFLIDELGLHDWAWIEQRVYSTMHSKRKIYLEENPSINFANFIRRIIVALIYGFYKCGSLEYESYSLPPLDFLYNQFYKDKNIKQEVKNLVEQDLFYF